MTQKITVPDLTYSINGNVVELQQSMGCGEYAVIDVHKIHLKLIAEEMRITEPTPASMNEIVKLELMELLAAIGEIWGDIGDKSHTDLTMLTDAKTLHQKCLSICRIVGCEFEGVPTSEELINDSLPQEMKESLKIQNSLLEAQ